MFKDSKLSQIIITRKDTREVLAVIDKDGHVLNPCTVEVSFNYGEPRQFILVED